MNISYLLDPYRLRLFRQVLDKYDTQILTTQDQATFKSIDRIYWLGFWSVFLSIPVNMYYGVQI